MNKPFKPDATAEFDDWKAEYMRGVNEFWAKEVELTAEHLKKFEAKLAAQIPEDGDGFDLIDDRRSHAGAPTGGSEPQDWGL
jgi:hypothetical protein